jgi:hypothetical protein
MLARWAITKRHKAVERRAMALGSPKKSFQKQLKTLVKEFLAKSSIINSIHKRAEGRAPVWGSDFTTKDAHYRGIQRKPLLG